MYVTQNSHRESCDTVYIPGEPFIHTTGQSIFVKTDYVRDFFSKVSMNVPFVLVTGVSDYSPSTFFTDEQLLQILDNPLLIEWRAQNVCTEHPKLVHIPIGLEDTPEKLDFCKNHEAELKAIPKVDDVYTNFTPDTNPHERNCFVSVAQKVSFEEYMRTMAGYKYVMCPMGNGLDTHRFWEAQVCGCIPIVRCPKEFLPTYKNVPFVSLPGWCFARMGHPAIVQKRQSIYQNYPTVPIGSLFENRPLSG